MMTGEAVLPHILCAHLEIDHAQIMSINADQLVIVLFLLRREGQVDGRGDGYAIGSPSRSYGVVEGTLESSDNRICRRAGDTP